MSSPSLLADISKLPSESTDGMVLLFGASWHESSVPGGDVYKVLQTLSSINDKLQFGRVEAEECPDLVQRYGVTVIPTICCLDSTLNLVEKLVGVQDVALVTQAVQKLSNQQPISTTTNASPTATVPSLPAKEEVLEDKLKRLVSSSQVMLFMKGTPDAPRCGFSRQIVELLQESSIAFGSFDILQDQDVRQGLKSYSDWPTYPQLYVKGELMGGLDIVKEMKEDTTCSLAEQMGLDASTVQAPASLNERLGKLVKRHRIMLFLKGLPSAPRCGFSRQTVELLDKHSANYDSFDILQDEEVRQGLKEYSNWPTYPQLYIDGDLIGGLDILKEMEEGGELEELLKEP